MGTSVTNPVERLREGILAKAKQEAEEIIKKAENEAKRIIQQAREKKQREIEELRKRIRDEIGFDVKIAEAKVRVRHMLAQAKNEILNKLKEEVLKQLNSLSDSQRVKSLKNIVLELKSQNVLPQEQKMIIYVNERDVKYIKEVLKELDLISQVREVRTIDIIGGLIIETEDSAMRIDASYEKRLEQILRYKMRNLTRELFS
ncbi:MAG TPA: hypothetical protein ENF93_00350 [Ignisphaera sp.]|nr:hypothetical protein [Ignisphaera sp.]